VVAWAVTVVSEEVEISFCAPDEAVPEEADSEEADVSSVDVGKPPAKAAVPAVRTDPTII